jgi:ammonium transporter, Amt family
VFYGNHPWNQLKAQFIGSATCVIVVGGFSLIMFWVIKQIPGTWNLRISQDGELEGIDIHEHGTPAYHVEFGYGMSYTTPTGLPGPMGRRDQESESVSS